MRHYNGLNPFVTKTWIMATTRFYIGADHAGYGAKEALQKFLARKGVETIDLGTHSIDPTDYPDYAEKVARKVVRDRGSFGLLICGSGIGMSIAANKVKGIRAANPASTKAARLAREHNDANVICLGGRTNSIQRSKKILTAFLGARPSHAKRHLKRTEKIAKIEKSK